MNETVLLAKAYNFAAQCHETQCRKGERAEPYINHLTEVAELVAQATDGQDIALIAAAVLHDTIEDTKTSYDDLVREFGNDIAGLVQEATDDTALPKQTRKQMQIDHAPDKTDRAKILKLADKISNIRSIAYGPPDWPLSRKKEYLSWSDQVAMGLKGANVWIDTLYEDTSKLVQKELERLAG